MEQETNYVDGVSTAIPAPVDTPVTVDENGLPVDPGEYRQTAEPDTEFSVDDVMSQFKGLFDGTGFTADFRVKVANIFNAAITEAVNTKRAELAIANEEEILKARQDLEAEVDAKASKIEEEVAQSTVNIVEAVDNYLDMIAERFLDENAIAIESSAVVAKAESIFEALQTLMVEHNIEVPESDVNIVSELEEELETAKQDVNRSIKEKMQLVKENETLRRQLIVKECTRDLTDLQTDRLQELTSKIGNVSESQFKSDVLSLKQRLFESRKTAATDFVDQTASNVITESNDNQRTVSVDDEVGALVRSIESLS